LKLDIVEFECVDIEEVLSECSETSQSGSDDDIAVNYIDLPIDTDMIIEMNPYTKLENVPENV
jgi:hypothetical protein